MNYTEEQKEKMIKSARSGGAVGTLPLCIKYLMQHPEKFKGKRMLDFGCGKDRRHVKLLNLQPGYNVSGHDFDDLGAWYKSFYWDVIFASNVINIQPGYDNIAWLARHFRDMICLTAMSEQIAGENSGGRKYAIVNVPKTPWYPDDCCPSSVRQMLYTFGYEPHPGFKGATNFDASDRVWVLEVKV